MSERGIGSLIYLQVTTSNTSAFHDRHNPLHFEIELAELHVLKLRRLIHGGHRAARASVSGPSLHARARSTMVFRAKPTATRGADTRTGASSRLSFAATGHASRNLLSRSMFFVDALSFGVERRDTARISSLLRRCTTSSKEGRRSGCWLHISHTKL